MSGHLPAEADPGELAELAVQAACVLERPIYAVTEVLPGVEPQRHGPTWRHVYVDSVLAVRFVQEADAHEVVALTKQAISEAWTRRWDQRPTALPFTRATLSSRRTERLARAEAPADPDPELVDALRRAP